MSAVYHNSDMDMNQTGEYTKTYGQWFIKKSFPSPPMEISIIHMGTFGQMQFIKTTSLPSDELLLINTPALKRALLNLRLQTTLSSLCETLTVSLTLTK